MWRMRISRQTFCIGLVAAIRVLDTTSVGRLPKLPLSATVLHRDAISDGGDPAYWEPHKSEPMSHPPGQRLAVYIDRFQYIAGCVQYSDPQTLLADLEDLLGLMPERMPVLDELAVRTLFAQALSRVLHTYRIVDEVKIEREMIAFMSCGIGTHEWHRRAGELRQRCQQALEHARQPPTSKVAHVQVTRALRMMDARYSHPSLSLSAVAAEIGVSASHLSRELKQHTKRGFVAHLHERRIAAAIHLLNHSPHLAIKQVAADVGYRSVVQLARHCKRLHGVAPTTIRARASASQRAAG